MKTIVKYRLYSLIYLLIFSLAILNTINYEKKMSCDSRIFSTPQKMELTVKVRSFPTIKKDILSFTASCINEKRIRCFVHVNIDYAQNLELYPGDILSLRGTVKSTDKPLNTNGYDYSQYLISQGVATEIHSGIYNISGVTPGLIRPLYILRQKISGKISKYLPPDEAGLVNALVTGDKALLSDEIKDAFRSSGLYHIIAVSGLHLNLVIMFISIFFAASNLRKRAKNLLSVFMTLLVCIMMFLFTGLGISVERAAFMAVVCCASAIFMREYSPEVSLFTIGIIILFAEPYSINDTSFLLSFSATAGVLCGVRLIKKWDLSAKRFSVITETAVISICTTIFTLPFTIKVFSGFSTIGILSNLLVIPIVPILLGLSYIFAVSCVILPSQLTALTAFAVAVPAYAVNTLAKIISYIPHSYIYISDCLFVLLFVNICILSLCIALRKRKAIIFVLLITTVANLSNMAYNILADKSEVTFLNAKQGDCSIIRSTDGITVMIDCGSEDYTSFGKTEVVSYLRGNGISKIDALFLTHFHEDHANGAEALIENGFIRRLFIPDRSYATDEKDVCSSIIKTAVKSHIPIEFLSEGNKVVIGSGHVFDILNPDNRLATTANDGSLVISYSYNGKTVLFMGDTEEKTTYRILDKLPECDIIKLPHHGDKNNLSSKTADKTKAKYAVISCGENNIYGHPAKETLSAYRESEILRTDKEGKEIQFVLKKDKILRRK